LKALRHVGLHPRWGNQINAEIRLSLAQDTLGISESPEHATYAPFGAVVVDDGRHGLEATHGRDKKDDLGMRVLSPARVVLEVEHGRVDSVPHAHVVDIDDLAWWW